MTVRTTVAALVVVFIAIPAQAQSIAGTWTGSADTAQGPFPLTFNFAIEDGELTGSLLNDFLGEIPLLDGMIDGNIVSFVLSIAGGGPPMNITLTGEVDGDEMTLTPEFEGGPPPGGGGGTLTLTRAE